MEKLDKIYYVPLRFHSRFALTFDKPLHLTEKRGTLGMKQALF